jgi:hypothetical protein
MSKGMHTKKGKWIMKKKEAICPVCHKPEKIGLNVNPEDLVMCSSCLQKKLFKFERSQYIKSIGLTPKEDATIFTKKVIPENKCSKCGKTFKPSGTRQKVCPGCKKNLAKSRKSKQRSMSRSLVI